MNKGSCQKGQRWRSPAEAGHVPGSLEMRHRSARETRLPGPQRPGPATPGDGRMWNVLETAVLPEQLLLPHPLGVLSRTFSAPGAVQGLCQGAEQAGPTLTEPLVGHRLPESTLGFACHWPRGGSGLPRKALGPVVSGGGRRGLCQGRSGLRGVGGTRVPWGWGTGCRRAARARGPGVSVPQSEGVSSTAHGMKA